MFGSAKNGKPVAAGMYMQVGIGLLRRIPAGFGFRGIGGILPTEAMFG
jgi:hypothetical protein